MDKNLKDTISAAKSLQEKGLMYLNDSVGLEAEPNYQILALIIDKLKLLMDREKYELVRNNEEKLIYEIALLNFNENDLIDDEDVEFMKKLPYRLKKGSLKILYFRNLHKKSKIQ